MKLKNNITIAYIVTILSNLVFAYVIERLFWESRGMSVKEVVYTEFIYIAAIMLFELPAGILTDKIGYKPALLLSAACTLLEFTLTIFANSFFDFAIIAIVAAAAGALYSGTFNSIIYETLKQTNRESEFTRVLSRLNIIDNLSVIFALALGGFISQSIGMINTYWLAALSSGTVLIAIFFVTEPAKTDTPKQKEKPSDILKKGLVLFKNDKNLLIIAFSGILINSTIVYLDEFMTLYLRDKGLPIPVFGFVLAGAYLARAAGNHMAGLRFAVFHKKTFYYCMLAFMLLLLAMFGFLPVPAGLAVIALLYCSWGLLDVLCMDRIHQNAGSGFRATAESVYALAISVSGFVFGILFGLFADITGTGKATSYSTFISTGVIVFAYLLIKIIRFRKKARY